MDRLERFLRKTMDTKRRLLTPPDHLNWADEALCEVGIMLARGWLIERARVRRLRDQLDACEGGPFDEDEVSGLNEEIELLREAVYSARYHVLRQLEGRHEQDRADAKAWLEKWGSDALE